MRVWVLPDPGSSYTIEDSQLLAVGIAFFSTPTGERPSFQGGGLGAIIYWAEYMAEERKRYQEEIEEHEFGELLEILLGSEILN